MFIAHISMYICEICVVFFLQKYFFEKINKYKFVYDILHLNNESGMDLCSVLCPNTENIKNKWPEINGNKIYIVKKHLSVNFYKFY